MVPITPFDHTALTKKSAVLFRGVVALARGFTLAREVYCLVTAHILKNMSSCIRVTSQYVVAKDVCNCEDGAPWL